MYALMLCIYGMYICIYVCMYVTRHLHTYHHVYLLTKCMYIRNECMYDRYVYQRATSQQKYGALLKQWEKREAAGEKLLQEATSLLSSLPASSSSLSSIDAHENDGSSVMKDPLQVLNTIAVVQLHRERNCST